MAVLGISVNSRIVSMAIVHHGSLVDYKVHLYKERWSQAKAKRMINSLKACIAEHSITSIAILLPHVHHTSPQTKAFISRIQEHCRTQDYAVSTFQPSSLHCLCEASKAKKKALMTALADRYPELLHIHKKELRNKNKYYHKLFEAVGAATLIDNY